MKKNLVDILKKAADFGSEHSMYKYARIKNESDGVEIDKQEAIKYY